MKNILLLLFISFSQVVFSQTNLVYGRNDRIENKEEKIKKFSADFGEEKSTVIVIDGIAWSNRNLTIEESRGERFKFAKNLEEWKKYCDLEDPVYSYPNFDSSNVKSKGFIYNEVAAIMINRDLDLYFRIPRKKEWDNLFLYTGSPNSPYACLSGEYSEVCSNRPPFNLRTVGFIDINSNRTIQFKSSQQGFWAMNSSTELFCIWFKEKILMDREFWTSEDLHYLGASIRGIVRD